MGRLRSLYLEIDLRTLAAVRIGLGSLLLLDLLKRIPSAGLWYINNGLLPNHRMLWHPGPYAFSLLAAFWNLAQVRVAFALIAIVYLCFLAGYRTRLFHVLSWLSLVSLQARTNFLVNGGDYVFGTLLMWTAFLPLGARWSVDSVRFASSGGGSTYTSLAVGALRLQLIVIYLFNALNKTGRTWKDGSAVHYLLHQARIVTVIGVWVREHAPTALLQALAYGTLVVEYAIPLLILMPWFRLGCSRLAVLLIWSLHGSIALLSNLGVFSPTMMVFGLSLLRAEDFDWLFARERVERVAQAIEARVSSWVGKAGEPSARRVNFVWLREATVAYLMLCATSQLIVESPRLLGRLAHEQPALVRATIAYLRLNQGWSMFAPDAPTSDAWVVVDALTVSGRHVDPLNRRGSIVSDPALRSIPPRLGQDVYFCDYTLNIPDEGAWHDALQEWIMNHSYRVHRQDETVLSFDAYLIEHQSPPLGKLEPTDVRHRVWLHGVRSE